MVLIGFSAGGALISSLDSLSPYKWLFFSATAALIDLELPGLSGNELARCLRANAAYADMTLLAITGYGRPRDRREAMEQASTSTF